MYEYVIGFLSGTVATLVGVSVFCSYIKRTLPDDMDRVTEWAPPPKKDNHHW